MIFELKDEDKKKVLPLIKNSKHELSVEAAIHGYGPSEIYVDNLENPKAGLFKGEECNLLFGDPKVGDFYWEIFQKIDYYDYVTCDDNRWNSVVEEFHYNKAIKQYTRYVYKLNKSDFIEKIDYKSNIKIELIEGYKVNQLKYENSEIVKNWVTLKKLHTLPGFKVAAIIIVDNKIVSCSCVDCYLDNRIEIGINTNKDYRGNGYAILATSELIKATFNYGIEEIGWHCVSSNIGSYTIAQKLGFKRERSYTSYTPVPPIENVSDLTVNQWIEQANYYESKADIDPVQYWIASQCWAKAQKREEVLKCFDFLIKSDVKWFIEYIDTYEEFQELSINSKF